MLDVLIESLGHAAAALPAAAGPYLVAALVVLAGYAPGRWLAGPLDALSALERWALSLGLGLVVLGTVSLALGLAGAFSRPGVLGALALLHLPLVARRFGAWRRSGGAAIVPRLRRPAAVACGLAAAALALFVGTLALYPPLGFDTTLYHLPMAKAFATAHRLPYLPDLRAPVFPQLSETLFGVALLFGDDRAARLVELAITVVTGVALFGWTRQHGSSAAGLWAAALWAGSPFVVLFGADAYVDVTLALFALLALVAFDAWRGEREGRWPWIAGAFAGAAAATKYLGLFFVAAVPLGFVLAARAPRRLRAAVVALLAALAVGGPWYARIAYYTGNPVFPFLPGVFGTSEWVPFVGLGPAAPAASALGGSWLAAAGSALRSVTFGASGEWQTWTGPPPFDPFLWVLAPAALLLLRRPRAPLLPIALGLSFAPAVWLLAPEPRYLLPALPWACAATALGLDRLVGEAAGRWPGWRRHSAVAAPVVLLAASVVLLAAPGGAYAAYRVARQGPVPRAAAERESFLAARRPGYGAIRFLNRTRGADYTLYGLGAEDLRYFADGRFRGEWSGPARFSDVVAAARRGPPALAEKLRRLDADFLLVVLGPDGRPRASGGADLGRGLPLVYRDAGSRLYAVPAAAEGAGVTRATTP